MLPTGKSLQCHFVFACHVKKPSGPDKSSGIAASTPIDVATQGAACSWSSSVNFSDQFHLSCTSPHLFLSIKEVDWL